MKAILSAAFSLTPDEIGLPHTTETIGGGIVKFAQLTLEIMGAVAVLIIIYGGIQMIISTGNPARIARSRDTVLYAVVGLIVAILSWSVVTFIIGNIYK